MAVLPTSYTIGELASEFEVTTRTIRHYEEQGLLSPGRDGSSRVFSPRDRVRLKLALRGKRLGFSLREIRELFELYDAKDEQTQVVEFLAKLDKRRQALEQQREDIEIMLNEINFFAEQCRRSIATRATDSNQKAA